MLIGILYYIGDTASVNIANALRGIFAANGIDYSSDPKENKKLCVMKSETSLLEAEYVDKIGFELIYFLSKHSSAKGISAFTTHPEGNWSGKADLGGKPSELSFAAPVEMLSILQNISKIKKASDLSEMEVSYEATHHGPQLKTPSMFVELGGNQRTIENKELAQYLATAIFNSMANADYEYNKVVIGIGGTHYPKKFSQLAIEKGYAFAHIMPKYAISAVNENNLFMLEQAVERSKVRPEIAVIEWKSINVGIRNKILDELNKLGMDYEKV